MAYSKRRAAIRRRRIFLTLTAAVLTLIIAAIALAVSAVLKKDENPSEPTQSSSIKTVSSEPEIKDTYNPDKTELVNVGGVELDANFRRVLLVNNDNLLPDNYDDTVKAKLKTVDKKYRNNDYVTDVHEDIYPYITAMVAAAQSQGVDLRVWSPFRSSSTQRVLFENQVKKMQQQGFSGQEAEDKAATVVTRPGRSEHNTGLCADFNMASESFEQTKMFTWMKENAENYGFILRYPSDKQEITGIIYESWHWRFVGINTAKEMNSLNMCLEEYIEYKEIDFKSELN